MKVRVSNTGARAGDEVVQLYIKNLNDIPNQPIHSLKAYKRIHLDPGESQMVNLNLRADAFAYIDDQGEKFDGEKFKVFVGGGQPGFDNTSQVVSKVVSLKSRD